MFRLFSRGWRGAMCCLIAMLATASPPVTASEGLTFAQALAIAQQQSPVLQAEMSRVEAALQDEGPADALPNPTLILGLDNVPVEGDARYSLSGEPMTMQRIGISQRFPNRGKRQALADGARARTAAAQARVDSMRLLVMRETAGAWIDRHSLLRQRRVIDALIEENALFEAAVLARIAGGQGRAADSVEPRREAARLADRRDAVEARLQQAEASLVRWLGDAGHQPLAGEPPDPALNIEHIVEHLHQHPELEEVARRTQLADATLAAARAGKKPDWSLTLAYMNREDFSDMAMLQVNIDLPLFNGTRQGPRIAAALAERQAWQANAEAVRRDHEAMLQAEIAEYQRLARALARQRDTLLPLAEEKVALVTAAWESGELNLADVIKARSELLDAQLADISLHAQFTRQATDLRFRHLPAEATREDNRHDN